MPDSDKPMTPNQHRHSLACRDVGRVDCGFETTGESVDEIRDAMMRHYIDEHPGHKIEDALTLALADRYRS